MVGFGPVHFILTVGFFVFMTWGNGQVEGNVTKDLHFIIQRPRNKEENLECNIFFRLYGA